MCPLEFWKKWQNHLPGLAKIAKKYKGVQASSAACERMLSTAGNIFFLKHKRMSVLPGMCWKKNPWVGATFFSAHPRPPMKFSLGWEPYL